MSLAANFRQSAAVSAYVRGMQGNRKPVFLKTSLLLLLCVALTGTDIHASSRWIKFKSAHFELLTSADKKHGESLTRFFEQVRSLFESSGLSATRAPDLVKIIAFNSDPEFSSYRLNETTAAFFAGGTLGDYIVLKSASSEYRPMAIHEYVHLLMRYSGLPAPLWWQEGLAEFYSTLRVTSTQVVIGTINDRHYDLLKRQPLLGFPELLGADRDSDLYNRSDEASRFYAESWALVHMLLLSEQYQPKSEDFVRLLTTDMEPSRAFREVYGKTLVQVQNDLEAYLQRAAFRRRFVAMNPERIAKIPAPTPATDLELRIALANVSLGIGKGDQARRTLDTLSRSHPDSWQVEEALGYVSWYEADRDQARIHFGRAVEKGMTNAKTYLDYVELLSETRAANSTLITLLEKALMLQPDSRHAALKLAALYLSEGGYKRALDRIARVKDIPPDEAFQTLCLQSYAFLGLGNVALARKSAEEAGRLAKTTVETRELDQLLRALSAQPAAGAFAPPAAEIPPRQPAQVLQSDPAGASAAAKQPASVQQARAPEVRRIEGKLRRIDCLETNLSFVIQAGGRDWAFLILDVAHITVKGRKGDKVLFYCGLQPGMPVVITYVPKPNPRFGTAGEMVAVEYL